MKINLDNSSIKTFSECQAKYIIQKIFNRTGKNESELASAGGVIHDGLEAHFNGEPLEIVLDTAWESYVKTFGYNHHVDDRLNWHNFEDHLTGFSQMYPMNNMPYEVISTEKMIGVELGNSRSNENEFIFWGKQDVLIQNKMSHFVYALDHKTRWGRMDQWWLKNFKHCSQFTGYIWLTLQHLDELGRLSEGALTVGLNAINMALLPRSNRWCKKHNSTHYDCRREHVEVIQQTYNRQPNQIISWRHWLDDLFNQIYRIQVVLAVPGVAPHDDFVLHRRTGPFTESCKFCSLADWCTHGFDPELQPEMTKPYRWEPWEEGESYIVQERPIDYDRL